MNIPSNSAPSFLSLASWFFGLTLLLLLCPPSSAQRSPFSVSITPSVRVRSTLMNTFNFRQLRYSPYIPYYYERNSQSISLGTQVKLGLGTEWSVSYTPFVRYGYAYSTLAPGQDSVFGFPIYERTDHKKILVDQQFWLSRQLSSRPTHWYIPSSVAVGWGIINTGQRYYLQNGNLARGVVRVETNTVDFAAGFGSPMKRWAYQLAAHYLYQGMASNRTDKFLCYSMTVGYRLIPHSIEPRE